ncbi:MAG TPA: response regulator [Woeseiaceae bacterium]|nr:response regulator [Woeseiaceae bacterium]
MQKTALIVDDSRSARIVLKRMLEAHELLVDTAESAEAALRYLTGRRPDVIFMDHLMPGMDGFEAVTAIKKNPHTATIPIMMYTSQAGELYVGQARALGAVGVLPKQVEPVEVSKVLASLRVIDTEPDAGAGDLPVHAGGTVDSVAGSAPLDAELKNLLQDLFDQQRIILQREFRDTSRNLAMRLASEVRRNDADANVPVKTTRNGPAFAGYKAGTVLLTVLLLLLAGLLWQRERTVRNLEMRTTALSAALDRQRDDAGVEPGLRRQLSDYRLSLQSANTAVLDALEWGVNRSGAYAFDDVPLGESRLVLFQELFARLVTLGFAGEIRVDVHVGNYCMLASGTDGYRLAPDDIGAEACDRIGFDPGEALGRGNRQSVAFANFVNVAGEQAGGAIRFNIVSRGNSLPQYPYPATTAGISAAQWNDIAARNNRVDVALRPDRP